MLWSGGGLLVLLVLLGLLAAGRSLLVAHVHGIGVVTDGGRLLRATHDGPAMVDEHETRVGPAMDLTGFAVSGPDRLSGPGAWGPASTYRDPSVGGPPRLREAQPWCARAPAVGALRSPLAPGDGQPTGPRTAVGTAQRTAPHLAVAPHPTVITSVLLGIGPGLRPAPPCLPELVDGELEGGDGMEVPSRGRIPS